MDVLGASAVAEHIDQIAQHGWRVLAMNLLDRLAVATLEGARETAPAPETERPDR